MALLLSDDLDDLDAADLDIPGKLDKVDEVLDEKLLVTPGAATALPATAPQRH